MTTRGRGDAFDSRPHPASLVSPLKRSGQVPSAHEDEDYRDKKQDTRRTRIAVRDRSGVGDVWLDSDKYADREEVNTTSDRGFISELKEEAETRTTLHRKETEVRGDDRASRDVAQLDSRKSGGLNLRDSRDEDGHELCEEEQQKNKTFEDAAGIARNRILQESLSQGVRQAQLLHHQQQSQPQQAPVVRWERFLPQRQLRVLLVEDDDSTRHVVSALLRNCSYEVTSAANGFLAWEMLMDQANHVDLVLTEVVMPCLSGIGLLSRIMGHGACKHIPVIMMSSHDSMGIVFKCLSKGAVDFLVKPVRKNELKNLWQHVWRRCHSSSGSGSGSGSQTQRVAPAFCNNSCSNDESDNASSGLNIRGGSDNGSGTQSSWTKRAVEVESSQQQTDWNSTQPNAVSRQHAPKQPDKLRADRVKGFASAGESHEEKGFDHAMGQDLEMHLVAAEPTYLHNDEGLLKSPCAVQEITPATSSGEGLEDVGIGLLQESERKAIDLIGAIAGKAKSSEEEEQGETEDGDELLENHASNSPSSRDKTVSDSNSPALLELSLKRPRQSEEEDRERDDRRVLRHSCSSAFSRYNTNGNHTLLPSGTLPNSTDCKPAGYGGHPFYLGSGPLPAQLERVASSKDSAGVTNPIPFPSNISCVNNKQDGGLLPLYPSGKDGFAACTVKEEAMPLHPISGPGMPTMPIPLPPGILYDGVPTAYGHMQHPMLYGHAATHWGSTAPGTEKNEAAGCCGSFEQSQSHPPPSQTHQPPRSHHHTHHHSHHHHHHIQHHYHHHQHPPQQRPMTPQQEDQTVTNVGAGAPRCGSSNMVNGPEGNTGQSGSSNGIGNGSVNGSATGSNNGSNGRNGHTNGQSATILAAGGNGDIGTQPLNGGTGTGNGLTVTNGVLSCPDQNRFARREAALTKFRQKRKERCFEKKVRYQSRKRLAEQRPRVRGQFVRQSVYESTAGEPD